MLGAIRAAGATPEILAAIARATWHNAHYGEACPDDAIPDVEAFLDAPAVSLEDGEEAGQRFDALIEASRDSPYADMIGSFEATFGGAVFRLPVWIMGLLEQDLGMMIQDEEDPTDEAGSALRGFPVARQGASKRIPFEGHLDLEPDGEGVRWKLDLPVPEPPGPGSIRLAFVSIPPGTHKTFRELVLEAVHAWWKGSGESVNHPLAPLVRAWQAGRAMPATPFRPRPRASLPRFDKSTLDEARLLASREPAGAGTDQYELLRTGDVVDSCPTWLLGMFRRAVSMRTGRALGSTRGGMPWSFTLAIGGVAHFSIRDRMALAPFGRDLTFEIDEIIGWLHPDGWSNRRRDWGRLDAAFEETPSYRVTVGNTRYSVVSAFGLPAVYAPSANVTLNVRVPPSAAHGARFDWHRYHMTYAKHAPLQRALLATAGLLDRTAHNGNPLTRLVREPVLDADGKPKRERILGRDGKPRRDKDGRYRTRAVYTGELVPNPLLGSIQPAILPDKHLALFLGMADSGKNRHDAKAALETLNGDNVIDLERIPNGYRVFGPVPKAPR